MTAEATPGTGLQAGGALGTLVSAHRDVQQTRLALAQRGFEPGAEAIKAVEDAYARQIAKQLRAHPLYDWLPAGLRGVHVARLIAIIGDPWRFPGIGCTEGHAFAPSRVVDDRCPVLLWPDQDRCPGSLVARRGTGVRSLWHYLGLHVVDGRAPRKRKGSQADWQPLGRTAVLQPGGIAEQIVRLRVERYRDIYDATKARLIETRAAPTSESEQDPGAVADFESDLAVGADPAESEAEYGAPDGPEVVDHHASEPERGLRPFQIDAIARKVAAKAFVGDLLIEWKRRAG